MICILGGTFDPVHFGHLRPALDVQQALEIRCIQLLPCRVPPHRDPPQGSPEQRLELLRLAVADEPALAIDTRELVREGASYMVDTLESLRAEKGEESLCLALGMDALLGLESWNRWREIAKLCHLVVMQRPDAHQELRRHYAKLLVPIEPPPIDDAGPPAQPGPRRAGVAVKIGHQRPEGRRPQKRLPVLRQVGIAFQIVNIFPEFGRGVGKNRLAGAPGAGTHIDGIALGRQGHVSRTVGVEIGKSGL